MLVVPAWTEETRTAADSGFRGPVASVVVTVTNFSDYDGVRRAKTPWKQAEEAYDRAGRLEAKTEYREDGNLIAHSEYEYHANGKLGTATVTAYDYLGKRDTENVTEYGNDGSLVSEIVKNRYSRVINSWVRTESREGYAVEYYTTSSGSKYYVETAMVNGSGMLTEETRKFLNADNDWRKSYTYTSAGKPESVTHYYIGSLTGIWRYSYSSEGILERIIHQGPSGRVLAVRSYQYGDSGALESERSEHRELDEFGFAWSYRYDRNGNVLRERYEQNHTDFSIDITYEHDGNKRIIESRQTDSFGRPYGKNEYAYDQANQQTRNLIDQKGVITGFLNEYTYDREDRLTSSVRFDLKGTWQSASRSAYDERGNQIEYSILNKDGSYSTKTTYQYEYDDPGNWTVSSRFVSDNVNERYDIIQQTITRDITYHSRR